MGLNVHVIETTIDPNVTPEFVGQHWINTSTGDQWFSKGTSVVGDWVELGTGTVAHSATTGQTANDHHNESHTVVSHSDTTATGSELNELTDGSTTTLHSHTCTGDVTAAANITDNAIVRGDGGAKGIQKSGWSIDDNEKMFVDTNKAGYLLDINNGQASGGGGAKVCGGEVLGDIALKICDADGTFDIFEIEADQGFVVLGKTYAQAIIDNGETYGIDIQNDGSAPTNATDFNTDVGWYRIGGKKCAQMTFFQDGESDGESSTTSTTEQIKLTLTTPSLPSGNYRVGWSFEWNGSNGGYDVEVQVYDGATVLSRNEKAPEDSDAWEGVSGFRYRNSISGVHNFYIKYKSQNSSATARIRRARLEIWRVS